MANGGHFTFGVLTKNAERGFSGSFFWLIYGTFGRYFEKIGSVPQMSRSWPYIAYLYRTNGEVIEEVRSTKFLGVYIDQKLTWDIHIHHIKMKISKGIGIVGKMRKFVNDKMLCILYYSFVYPYIHYCIEIWGKAYNTHLNSILKLQKRAVRILTYSLPQSHSDPLFRKLKILPVHQVYVYNVSQFMYKFYDKTLPSTFANFFTHKIIHYNLRNKAPLDIPKHHLVTREQCISITGPKIWNYIHLFICNNRGIPKTLPTFKKIMKRYLNDYRYYP
jgi:hypothetical protein